MGLRHLQAWERVPGRKEAVNGEEQGDKGGWGEGGSWYYNPDPLCRLIGPKNEVKVVVNDEEVTGLVDSGEQISAVSMAFAEKHDLPIWKLQQLLDFEGFGGVEIPYIGYTQIQLKIPGIQGYNKDILVFIQNDSRYSERIQSFLALCTSKIL